jgi:hypothetical protein
MSDDELASEAGDPEAGGQRMHTETHGAARRGETDPRSADDLEQSYGSKVLLMTVVVLVLMAAATLWWPRP